MPTHFFYGVEVWAIPQLLDEADVGPIVEPLRYDLRQRQGSTCCKVGGAMEMHEHFQLVIQQLLVLHSFIISVWG